jgi:hypothetical protein
MKEIEKYLPEGWEEKAKETGALRRSRNIKTAEELLALNMLYITNDGSFQMTSAAMKLMKGIEVNKNAAYKRIKASGEWLRVMAEELCATQGAIIEKPEFLGDKQVKLVDASDETTKGKEKSTWRLHYVFNLFAFQCTTMDLTTNKEGERLTRHDVSENDIMIADRVYCTMRGIEHVLKSKADFVLRFRSKAFYLYDESGNSFELLPHLRQLKSLESTDMQVFYKLPTGELRPLRIVAMKKEMGSIEESKRKMLRKASRKQEKAVQAVTAELNEYVVLATSLEYTNAQILELYRTRWQIEQVFYRLKSLFGYGEVPSKNPDTVKAWFYGKLFLAALCERVLKALSFPPEAEPFIVNIVTAKLME